MRFYVLEPDARLVRGAYGIAEPAPDAPLCEPDAHTLCILPGLSFDTCGNRIGYGKGYYDRFLADFHTSWSPRLNGKGQFYRHRSSLSECSIQKGENRQQLFEHDPSP